MQRERTGIDNPGADLHHLGPPWLTVESGLYILFVLLAASLRLYSLGGAPLQEGEARLALDAWRFYTGGVAGIRGHSPLLFHAGVFSYLLFGAKDFAIRLLPALAGTALVATPYLLRAQLGRRAALVASALLAFSPSFVFFSRQANGDIVLAAASLALVSGVLNYAGTSDWRRLYTLATALGLGLLASGAAFVLLLILAGFLVGPALYRRATSRGVDSPLQRWWSDRPGRGIAVPALCLFAALMLLISTGLLVNLHGIQATLDLFSSWAGHFRPVAGGQPWSYYLSLLFAYELPVLVFGLAGACYLYRRGIFYTFLICWFGVSLVIYSLMGNKPASGIVLILLPLTLLAAKAIGDLLAGVREGQQWLWARLLLAISLPALFQLLLQLAAFGDPNNPGDPRNLMLVLLSMFFILCLVVVVGLLSLDWQSALRSGGLLVLVFLGGLMLRGSWRLNLAMPENPFEILSESTTATDMRNLTRALEDFSNQREEQRHSIAITVTGGENSLLAWYLKDFSNVSFVSELSSALAPVVITPFPASEQLPEYRGARFRMESSWRGSAMTGHDLVNWYLFRESVQPATYREVVLWVAPEPEE
jgi:uncharacterized protein (TIGR03663 family)